MKQRRGDWGRALVGAGIAGLRKLASRRGNHAAPDLNVFSPRPLGSVDPGPVVRLSIVAVVRSSRQREMLSYGQPESRERGMCQGQGHPCHDLLCPGGSDCLSFHPLLIDDTIS